MRPSEMAAENIRGLITLNSISWKQKMAQSYKKTDCRWQMKAYFKIQKKNFFWGAIIKKNFIIKIGFYF